MKPHLKLIIWIAVLAFLLISLSGCAGPIDPEARKTLLASLGKTSVTVYPTFVRRASGSSYDPTSAIQMGDYLKAEKLSDVTVSNDQVPITGSVHANQAKMFRESALALGDFVKGHGLHTEYAAMAEYLMGSTSVMGIHCYVVDRQGRLAAGVLLNSHHKIFSSANPKTVEDCTGVVISALKQELKKIDASGASKK